MNTNYFIPTVIVDDFFEDPDALREYALSLPYNLSDPTYPGVRTDAIHTFNEGLFRFTVNRLMSIFYDLEREPVDWNAHMYFQKVGKENQQGWIHNDRADLITGIIYLNKNTNNNSGTSIVIPKDVNYTEYNKLELNDEAREKHNSQFEEVVNLKNRFNRLVAFDSARYHCANDFDTGEEERLTLVFFIRELYTKNYPIYRMRKRR